MPLFECSECKAIDNTATGDYWCRTRDGKPPLCAECSGGEWHGRFEKRNAEASGYTAHNASGYVFTPESLEPGGSFAHCYRRCTCNNVQDHYPESTEDTIGERD